jgi:hypothetical protein
MGNIITELDAVSRKPLLIKNGKIGKEPEPFFERRGERRRKKRMLM